MIDYNPKTWLGLIFHAYSKQVIKTLFPALISMGLFTAAVCYVILDYLDLQPHEFPGSTAVHSLLGIVLGLFMVFRTNSAYDRWWEGRKLWGAIVNSSRNVALKLNSVLPKEAPERKWFAQMIGNFAVATKDHLREEFNPGQLEVDEKDLQKLNSINHKPVFFASLLFQKLEAVVNAEHASSFHAMSIDEELRDLVDCMGACERIRKTPIPYSYSMYIKKFIFIYIITLPFGFITSFGYVTIPIVLVVSYILLSVELIAEDIENPFGYDANDLPTDQLAQTIRANAKEILL